MAAVVSTQNASTKIGRSKAPCTRPISANFFHQANKMKDSTHLIVGTNYYGVLCGRCGKHVPLLARNRPVRWALGSKPGTYLCPYCGYSAGYRADELKSRMLTELPILRHRNIQHTVRYTADAVQGFLAEITEPTMSALP